MKADMTDQILEALRINNRINLRLIERISDEGMRCTLSKRGSRNVVRQFAHLHYVRVHLPREPPPRQHPADPQAVRPPARLSHPVWDLGLGSDPARGNGGRLEADVAYYEQQDAQPPGAMLVDLARALRVTMDELLGLKPTKEKTSPRTARLLKRLQKVEKLPPSDQRVVLKLVDGLLERQRSSGRP